LSFSQNNTPDIRFCGRLSPLHFLVHEYSIVVIEYLTFDEQRFNYMSTFLKSMSIFGNLELIDESNTSHSIVSRYDIKGYTIIVI